MAPRTGPRATPADLALGALLALQVLFQAALALGAPWGAASWGGAAEGVLPAGLRAASAVAALVWAWIALVVVRRSLGPVGRRRVLLVLAVYTSLGVVMNAVSPSVLEKAVWAPYCFVVAVLAWLRWRAARGETAAGATGTAPTDGTGAAS